VIALCINCGNRKSGVVVRCPRCGFQPLDPTDRARALLLSDRELDEALLEEAERSLAEHRPWPYDERRVAELAHRLALDPPGLVGGVLVRVVAAALALGGLLILGRYLLG